MSRYLAPLALLPSGWARDVAIEIDASGDIVAVVPDSPHESASHLPAPIVPGMPNVHSHAFQRILAGRTERAGGDDSFWSWRETMYDVVERIGPEDLETVATAVYFDMLKAGYTSVGEFHYVHHGPRGERYAIRTEMSERIIAAAAASGIGLTLLPAMYAYAGFGARPPSERQLRFTMEADEFLTLWDALRARIGNSKSANLGVAPHSLRAVSPQQLEAVVAHVTRQSPSAPIHVHVAEQQAEVDACVGWSGQRPVAWLLDHAAVNERWCLVHATHIDEAERIAAVASGAVAGLCPTTEANLGDGVFPAQTWLAGAGRIGIGSDSNVTLDPAEELRWLEYGQRLVTQRRAVLFDTATGSVGGRLFRSALEGGAQALGRRIGRIAPGYRVDIVVLDSSDPVFEGAEGDELLDRYIFAGARRPVRDVMCGGRWVVTGGRCADEAAVAERYRSVVSRLFARPPGGRPRGRANFPRKSG